MGEEDDPFVTNKIMKVYWAVGGFGVEIGSNTSQPETIERNLAGDEQEAIGSRAHGSGRSDPIVTVAINDSMKLLAYLQCSRSRWRC